MFILLYIFFINLKFGNISEALFWIQRGDFLLRNTWKDYSGRGYVLSRLSSFVYGYTLISHYFTQVTRIVNANAVGKSTTMLIVGLEIADCCQKAPLNLSVCYNMTLLLPPTPHPTCVDLSTTIFPSFYLGATCPHRICMRSILAEIRSEP